MLLITDKSIHNQISDICNETLLPDGAIKHSSKTKTANSIK